MARTFSNRFKPLKFKTKIIQALDLDKAKPKIKPPNYESSDCSPLKCLLRRRLCFISHPSMSNLECSINLRKNKFENDGLINDNFDLIVNQILNLDNFNPKQVIIRKNLYSVIFRDVAALKLLNLIFKDYSNHPLYSLYLNWIGDANWMKF